MRGKRDPTVYTCSKTDATLLHHVDDVRMGASDADLNFLQSKDGLGKYLDMKNGDIERPGTKVNVLGRTKPRTADAFFTLPDNKHRDNVLTLLDLWNAKPSKVAGHRIPHTEENTQPVDARRAELFPKCVGSLIYSSIDRRDIRFEVKELARHMRDPREVDWSNLTTLARYLLHQPDLARVTSSCRTTCLHKSAFGYSHELGFRLGILSCQPRVKMLDVLFFFTQAACKLHRVAIAVTRVGAQQICAANISGA